MACLHMRRGDEPERTFELERCCTAGGAEDASVVLQGAAPSALLLEPAASGFFATALVSGTSVSSHALAPGARRLVRPLEQLELGGWRLWMDAPPPPAGTGTAALAQRILAEGVLGAAALPVPTLVWLNGPDCGKRLPLLEPCAVLGRAERGAGRVRDALASRAHARVALQAGRATLEDLRSENGTRVDGKPVHDTAELRGGELIQIGETELWFDARLDPAPSAPAAVVAAARPFRVPRSVLEVALVAGALATSAAGGAMAWLALR